MNKFLWSYLYALCHSILAVSMFALILSRPALANKPPKVEVNLKTHTYWVLKNPKEAPYKNVRLAEYQSVHLAAHGIQDPAVAKMAVAILMTENGALSENVDGDNGRSIGIPQRNVSNFIDPLTKKRFTAKTFRERYPAWKDYRTQLDWAAAHFSDNLHKFGSVKGAVIAHNCPACVKTKSARLKAIGENYYAKVVSKAATLALK